MAGEEARATARRPREPGRKAIAYHEAGHAVAGAALRREIARVTIVPAALYHGCCFYKDGGLPYTRARCADPEFVHRVEIDIISFLAGPIAEERATKRASRSHDAEKARRLARLRAAGEEEAEEHVRAALCEAEALVEARWPAIVALAKALLRYGELKGGRAMKVIRRALIRSGLPEQEERCRSSAEPARPAS